MYFFKEIAWYKVNVVYRYGDNEAIKAGFVEEGAYV